MTSPRNPRGRLNGNEKVHANLFAKAKIFAVRLRKNTVATRLRLVFPLRAHFRGSLIYCARIHLFPISAGMRKLGALAKAQPSCAIIIIPARPPQKESSRTSFAAQNKFREGWSINISLLPSPAHCFVLKDNKPEVSGKLGPAAQKRGFACRIILGNACSGARKSVVLLAGVYFDNACLLNWLRKSVVLLAAIISKRSSVGGRFCLILASTGIRGQYLSCERNVKMNGIFTGVKKTGAKSGGGGGARLQKSPKSGEGFRGGERFLRKSPRRL